MYCSQCGSEVRTGIRYCGKCGATLHGSGEEVGLVADGPTQSGVSADRVSPAANRPQAGWQAGALNASPAGAQPGRAPKKSKKPVAIVAAVLVALLCVGGFAFWQAQQAEWDHAHQLYSLDIDLGIDPAAFTLDEYSTVPVKVEGTDFEGNAVSETRYLTPDDHTIQVPRGEYTVTPAGDTVREGVLYTPKTGAVSVTVDEDGCHEATKQKQSGSTAASDASDEGSASTSSDDAADEGGVSKPLAAEDEDESTTSENEAADSESEAADTDDTPASSAVADEEEASSDEATESTESTADASESEGDDNADSADSESSSSTAAEGEPSVGGSEPVTLEFEPVAPEDVTDEQIAELEKWMSESEADADQASAIVDAVKEKRETRKQEIAAEEKARAEEEAARAEAERVEARKQAITDTAYEYIYRMYDKNEPNLIDSKNRGPLSDLYSPQAQMSSGQYGSMPNSLLSIDSFQVVDENTVSFTVTYSSGIPESNSIQTQDGTLVFDENALIVSGGLGLL